MRKQWDPIFRNGPFFIPNLNARQMERDIKEREGGEGGRYAKMYIYKV